MNIITLARVMVRMSGSIQEGTRLIPWPQFSINIYIFIISSLGDFPYSCQRYISRNNWTQQSWPPGGRDMLHRCQLRHNAGISVTTSVTLRHLMQSWLACHTRLTLTRPSFLSAGNYDVSKKLITAAAWCWAGACSRKLQMLSPPGSDSVTGPHTTLIRNKTPPHSR